LSTTKKVRGPENNVCRVAKLLHLKKDILEI
jgi:hypothetical protein